MDDSAGQPTSDGHAAVRPPERGGPFEQEASSALTVALTEYSAIRGEIQTSLENQQSILSFGAATIGLLVTAGATLWGASGGMTLASLMFAMVVPVACFLVMAIWFGELTRMLRAGLFLLELEKWINASLPGPVLAWEHWGYIRRGPGDLEALNRRAIAIVFFILAVAGVVAGLHGLDRSGATEAALRGVGATSVLTLLLGGSWLWALQTRAKTYRAAYKIPPYRDESKATPSAYDGQLHQDRELVLRRIPLDPRSRISSGAHPSVPARHGSSSQDAARPVP